MTGDNLKIDAPKGILTADLIEELKKRKQELVEFLKNNRERFKYLSLKLAEKKEYYPVTSPQKRLYVLQQMVPDNVVFNVPQYIQLGAGIDRRRLEAAFKALIRRHESFRTSFEMVNETLYQRIHEEVELSVNYSEAETPDARQIFREFVSAFDLSRAPLLRVRLLKVGHHHGLMVDVHHIIADGISIDILKEEFGLLYGGVALSPLRLRCRDYSEWQHSDVQQAVLREQEKYWLREFSAEIPVLDLATDYSRPPVQDFSGHHIHFVVGRRETGGLINLGKAGDATLYMTLFGLFSVLLWRLSGQEDMVIGTFTAGRRHADLENIVGIFVNTLAIRNYPTGEKSFVSFLREVKVSFLSAFENQEYPFEDLVERVEVVRDVSRNPLFDVLFALQNQREYGGEILDIADDRVVHGREGTSKFDLSLTVVEVGEKLSCDIEYSLRLFRPETIERFIGYFRRIVSAVVDRREMLLKEIEILGAEEKHRLVSEFNDTTVAYPADKRLEQLFVRQAEQTPENIALVFGDKQLTYRELNGRSSDVSMCLGEQGVESDEIVGIMVDRSLDMVIGILGILKSGAAYLPIDPSYPEARIRYMLKDSNTEILLAERALCEGLDFRGQFIDITAADIYKYKGGEGLNLNHERVYPSFGTAYIIYTSGSSGAPRGVLIDHVSVVNLVCCRQRRFEIDERDRILQFSSICFDASVEQIFICLFSGSVLVLISKDTLLDRDRFSRYISRHQVSHIDAVPSYLDGLESADVDSHVRRMVSGGDVCSVELALRWAGRCDFYNEYGPTETTIVSIAFLVEESVESLIRVPIGAGIANTQVYICDRWFNPVPLGVAGELYIGGDGVGRGYLNRGDLTEERFLGDPFKRGGRLYKTGDLARWQNDGNIEFLGRADQQVKVRGFRVEPGEIESELLRHPGVKEAVVIDRRDERDETYLCAYYVSVEELEVSVLREFLSPSLPAYMIPSYFVGMDRIPLTATGKVDRRALPGPEIEIKGYIAPGDETEEKLQQVWSQVLRVEREKLSVTANFFELGGHSMKATILFSKIQKEFNVNISLVKIFEAPNIRQLSGYIKSEEKGIKLIGDDSIVLLKQGDSRGENLFFIHDGTGEVEGYIELCQRLNSGLNCWGIRADRFKNCAPQNLSIEDVADKYIEKMLRVQPQGSYRLAGWSLGGPVAFEIVRKLEQLDKKIEFLAMIDTVAPNRDSRANVVTFTPESELSWIRGYLSDEGFIENLRSIRDLNQFWLEIVEYIGRNNVDIEMVRKIIPEGFRRLISNFDRLDCRELFYYFNVMRTFQNAGASYVPSDKINTVMHYFRASGSRQNWGKYWKDYTRNSIKSYKVAGDHFSMLKTPDVLNFIKKFRRAIFGEKYL